MLVSIFWLVWPSILCSIIMFQKETLYKLYPKVICEICLPVFFLYVNIEFKTATWYTIFYAFSFY